MRRLLFLIMAVFLSNTMNAQLSIHLGFNLDRQPIWGPAGYDRAEYYYLPDIGVYYNISEQRYYYNERGRWIGRSSLPPRYRGFDLYNSYKVVINERNPYRNDNKYREQYASYKGRHDQQPIRDARDEKYYSNPRHPEHNNWVKQHRNGNNGNGKGNNGNGNNGNGKGNGKDKDRNNK
jgi:hypothetical protein